MRHVFLSVLMFIVIVGFALAMLAKVTEDQRATNTPGITEVVQGGYREITERDELGQRHGMTVVFVNEVKISVTSYEHGRFVDQFDYWPSGRVKREIRRTGEFEYAAKEFEDVPNAVGVAFDFLTPR